MPKPASHVEELRPKPAGFAARIEQFPGGDFA
jgi:hypothetical protein